jgi:hypothetical protein
MKKLILLLLLIPTLCYGTDIATVGGVADSAISSIMGVAGTAILTLGGGDYDDGDVAGCSPEITDIFNRADNTDLGANWTEDAGTALAISTNQLAGNPGGGTLIARHNTATDSATQYVKIKLVEIGTTSHSVGVLIRSPAGTTGDSYAIEFDGSGAANWYYYLSQAYHESIQSTAGGQFADGDTAGITVQGTGNSTVVKIWKNPTNNCPVDANNWDAVSDAADYTLDADNTHLVADTGTSVAVFVYGTAGTTLILDDFYAGGL